MEASSEFYYDLNSKEVAPQSNLFPAISQLAQTLHSEEPESARFLECVRRGAETIRRDCWLLLEQVDCPVRVAKVVEMAEVKYRSSSSSVIRMWCVDCMAIREDQIDGVLYTQRNESGENIILELESFLVRVLMRRVTRRGHEYL